MPRAGAAENTADTSPTAIICRLCLSARGDTRPIFAPDRQTPAILVQRIKDCVSVQVVEDDGLPTQICKKCVSNVNNWYAFKKVCEDSQLKLRDWLNGANIQESELKIKREPTSEDDDIVIDASYPGVDIYEDGNRVRIQPEGPPILASLGLAPRNEKENEEEYNTSDGLVIAETPTDHLPPEMEHRPVPVEHLASKDCLVCGRAYRYSHNARRHELTSHSYDRYTNKIEPGLAAASARPSNQMSRGKLLENSQSQSLEPEILKSLLTAKQEAGFSESENVNSRSGTPDSMGSDSEMQPYQVETIISEPDTYMHHSDMSDDENDQVKMGQSPRSNSDMEYDDGELDLSSQLDINKIIGIDGDDYDDEYVEENEEFDDEGQNVSENVETEVVCSEDAELPHADPKFNIDNEQADDIPVSLVPIVELNENAGHNNIDSEDSELENESPVSHQSVMMNNMSDNNFTITTSQREFILRFRDVIEQINTMKCKCCNKDFPRRKAVIQHLQKGGSKIPKHTCYSCILSFNNIGAFLSHMRYNCCNDTWRLIYRGNDIPDTMVVDEYSQMDSQDSSEGPFKSQYKEVLHYRSYACRLCSAKHQFKELVVKHVIDVHESEARSPSLTCFNCGYKFLDKRLWKKHIQSGDCTIEVACELCPEKFNTTQEFNEHVLIVHMDAFVNQTIDNSPPTTTNRRSTCCSICNNSFASYYNMIKHLKIVHNEERPYPCQYCDDKFADISELNQHIYQDHSEYYANANGNNDDSEIKEEIMTYNYSCTECEAVFETVDGWTDHQIDVHRHVAYGCNQCLKKFWDKNELEEHKSTHRSLAYKCMLCPSSYGSTYKLSEHVLQCHRETAILDKSYESQFYCDICIRSFKSRQAFSNHMRIHAKVPTTNRRAGEVKRADTQFKVQQTQIQTSQVPAKPSKVVNPAPYSCDICGKGFLHKKNIWKHKKILHSNIVGKSKENTEVNLVKNASTEEDDYTNDGNSHLSTPQFDSFVPAVYDHPDNSGSEGNLMYQCDLCDKKFAVKSSIWKHKRVKHGVITPDPSRIDSMKMDVRADPGKSDIVRTSCTICKIHFTDKKAYYRHRKVAHKASIHMCKICGITLNTSMELFEHLQNAHAKELLGYNASHAKPVQKKVQISEPNNSSDDDDESMMSQAMMSHPNNRKLPKYSCETCGKGFLDMSALQTHNCSRQVSMSETYDCEICNKSYTSISALKSHRGWHLRSPDGRAAFSNSRLWMPQYKVTSKVSKHEVLEPTRVKTQVVQKDISPLHIKRKLPPDVQVTLLKKKKSDVSAENSPVATPYVPQSPVNQQVVVNEDRYCEPCGKVFTKKAAYQRHLDEVHKASTVFCPICNKSFTRKATLLAHMRKHDTGDISEPPDVDESDEDQEISIPEPRPAPLYRCEVCSLSYSSSKALRRHRLMKHHREVGETNQQHTNERLVPVMPEVNENVVEEPAEKEYKCRMCEEEFETEEEVYSHSHFCCSLCGMYFSQHQYLVEHTQAHHSVKEQTYFPCDKCDRFYMNKKSLQRHIESFH